MRRSRRAIKRLKNPNIWNQSHRGSTSFGFQYTLTNVNFTKNWSGIRKITSKLVSWVT